MYYKTWESRLKSCGWEIIDGSRESEPNEPGRLIPHYIKWAHPSDKTGERDIVIYAKSKKDGKPGIITDIFQGGRRCRI